MKWALYNVLFALVYPLILPGFLVRMLRRGGYAARMGDRFALYPEDVLRALNPSSELYDSHAPAKRAASKGRGPVWIHAVSVGEVQVAGQLMREWRRVEPAVRFVFSTTSSTGWQMALREIRAGGEGQGGDVLIYNPLDFPNFVKSALRTVRPRAIVLTESEIWPNFILKAKKEGIPLFLINARVSDRSAPRYRAGRFFFRDVLRAFDAIFAQSDLDRERLLAAGADPASVTVTGSFKFDVARRNPEKERELAAWLLDETPPAERPKILLGGSTWPGEDEFLLGVYARYLQSHPNARLRLVLAPRHFEKADAVARNIASSGFPCVRRSTPNSEARTPNAVYLADTTGELMGLYAIADVVFVGKSLCAHGSQNMIEPCLCGKPTFVGPYTENFRPVMSDLLAARAVVQAATADELERGIVAVLEGRQDELGARASEAVRRRQGVVERAVASIRRTPARA